MKLIAFGANCSNATINEIPELTIAVRTRTDDCSHNPPDKNDRY
jgi:hypothetical protein